MVTQLDARLFCKTSFNTFGCRLNLMKIIKIIFFLLLVYAGVVVLFESLLGYFQPQAGATMVVTTFAADGTGHDRVVAKLESGTQLYVAVNHWPRAWYRRMLRNPLVEVTLDGETAPFRAMQLSGTDYDRIDAQYSLGLGFRILTGFPPRHLFLLEPR